MTLPHSSLRVIRLSAACALLSALPLLAQKSELATPVRIAPVTVEPITVLQHAGLYAPQVHAVPDLVSGDKVTRVGATSTSKVMEVTFNLPLRNEDQLDALLADLYNPASPSFHKYLQPSEFDKRFGPVQADYDALVAWAQNNGFTVKQKAGNLRLLTVEGSVYVVNRALHLTVNDYNDAVANRTFFAPSSEPQMDLSVPILGIDGLDNANPPQRHYRKGTAAEISRSISKITGSGPGNLYLPSDMRAAYYGNGPLTGAGQTVAIFSFDGYIPSDLPLYYSSTGTTLTVPVTNVLVAGFSGSCVLDTPCDDGEQILDIAQVAGMAPGLTGILFYESNGTANPILNQMVTDDKAAIITSSWGGGGFGTTSDTYFKQMATQGQTYLNATGDDGSFDRSTYSAPSVDPYIVQVGGTDLVTNGAGGSWSSETGWVDSGGGFYAAAAQTIPTWQQTAGVITSANGGSTTYRNSPDLAAEANFDNPTVVNGLLDGGYGGTSFATPRYAGYLALANQQSVANGTGTLGFINPALYTLGLNANAAPTAYHDITSGTNPPAAGTATTFSALAGYDLVTGWGSPNGAGLINAFAGNPYQDFSIAGTNTSGLSLYRNGTVTDTLTIGDFNSFTGAVTFTATGLPTGITASFSPASSTTGTTVTFTADNTAAFSSSTFVVTGTSGTLTHSITYTVNVFKRASSDFSLSGSALSVAIGKTLSETVTVVKGSTLPDYVALSVSGLPAGVTASFDNAQAASSAKLTFVVGSSALPGTTNITITGVYSTVSLTHSITIPLTVTVPGTQLLSNPSFEGGSVSPWTITSSTGSTTYLYCTLATCGYEPHSGSYFLGFDGYGATHTDTAKQTVTIPAGASTVNLSFYLAFYTAETSATKANDTFTVQILSTSGTVLSTVATLSNLTARTTTGYGYFTYSLPTSLIGQTVVLSFTGTENNSNYTEFILDDVALYAQ